MTWRQRLVVAALVAAALAVFAAEARAQPTPSPSPVDNLFAPDDGRTVGLPDAMLPGVEPAPSHVACDPASGIGDMLGVPERSDPTKLDRYGVCGYRLHHRLSGGMSDWPLHASHGLASMLLKAALWLTAATVALVRWAHTLDLSQILGPVAAGVASQLGTWVFHPLLPAAIVLLGLWAVLKLATGQMALVAGRLLFALGAVTLGLAYLAAPERTSSAVADGSTGFRRGLMALAAYADPEAPHSLNRTAAAMMDGSASDWHVRQVEEQLWRTYGDMPWRVAQFGSVSVGDTYGEPILQASAYTPAELAAVQAGEGEAVQQSKQEQYDQAVERLERERPDGYAWFRGDMTADQVAVAGLAGLAAFVGGFVHAMLSGAVVVADAVLQLMWAAAPLAALAGAAPGFGNRVAARFVSVGFGLVLLQLLLSLLLGVDLVFVTRLLRAADGVAGGWYGVVVTSIAVTLAAWLLRRPFLSIFSGGMTAQADPSRTVERTFRQSERRALGWATAGATTVAAWRPWQRQDAVEAGGNGHRTPAALPSAESAREPVWSVVEGNGHERLPIVPVGAAEPAMAHVQTAQVPRETSGAPEKVQSTPAQVDWSRHRLPDKPEHMPGWPRDPGNDPDSRARADAARGAAYREWQEAQERELPGMDDPPGYRRPFGWPPKGGAPHDLAGPAHGPAAAAAEPLGEIDAGESDD